MKDGVKALNTLKIKNSFGADGEHEVSGAVSVWFRISGSPYLRLPIVKRYQSNIYAKSNSRRFLLNFLHFNGNSNTRGL